MKYSTRAAVAFTLAALFVWGCSPDGGGNRPPPTAPAFSVGQQHGSYLVQLAETANPEAVAATVGARPSHVYRHAIKGFAAELPEQAIEALWRNPLVENIEPDGIATTTGTQLNPPSWGLDRVDQRNITLDNSYTYPNTGAGVHAYIIDSGIRYSHQDFGGRAVFGADFSGEGTDGSDCLGHGTHVSGTVGGSQYGVAKAATLVSVRVFGCTGSAQYSTIIAAVDWVTANRQLPAVANMSLGGGFSQIMNDAVAASIANGVIYAISAGNSNWDACAYSPASTPTALTVGATTIQDFRASYSNYGPCVDLFAPGSAITSAWIGNNAATNTISGTSMSSPHVSGAAALYLSANPGAAPAVVSSALTAAATVGAIVGVGAGSPNRLLYVDWTQPPNDPPPPPADSAGFTVVCSSISNCTFQSSVFLDGLWYFSDWELLCPDGCPASGVTFKRWMQMPLKGARYITTVRHVVGSQTSIGTVTCHKVKGCWRSS